MKESIEVEKKEVGYTVVMCYLIMIAIMLVLVAIFPIEDWSHPIEAFHLLFLWGIGTFVFMIVINYVKGKGVS